MLIPFIIGAWVVLMLAFAGAWQYLNVLDRRSETRELTRFAELSNGEQLTALQDAETYMKDARFRFNCLDRLWRGYKWGYRHNPYFINRFTAEMEYARAYRMLERLKKLHQSSH